MRAFCLKIKQNQKGASLAYTLVIITILMMIGTSLATFAIMSLRISVIQHTADKAFYLSDAVMEETLTQLESQVHEAEMFALGVVNIKDYQLSEPKWIAFLRKLEQDTLNGTITKEESARLLQVATSYEFHKQYYKFLFGKPSGTWLIKDYTLLDTNLNYVNTDTIKFDPSSFDATFFNPLSVVSFDPNNKEGFENAPQGLMTVSAALTNNVIELSLTSDGQYNSYKKPINVTVALTPPDYKQIVTSETRPIDVHNNQILNYALASRENLIVTGSQNQINGNVYAYGTFPEKPDYRISEQGGVLVGYSKESNVLNTLSDISIFKPDETDQSANINISHDLYTRSSVKLFETNSELNVNGSLYANSILFDPSSNNATLNVAENAYLMEDLILDGTAPELTVGTEADPTTGELWGLSNKDASGSAEGKKSDYSASILINSTDLNPQITVNNLYMSGLSYFNAFRPIAGSNTSYQTGESFTTNNNYYFYKQALIGYNSQIQTKFFTYKENTVEHYLIEAVDSNGNIVQSPKFKAKYFYDSGYKVPTSISDRDRAIFTIRSIKETTPGVLTGLEQNYALGVVIANQRVIDAYPQNILDPNDKPVSEYMNESAFITGRRSNIENMDLNLNLLSTRNNLNHTNKDPLDTVNSKIGQFVDFTKTYVSEISDPNKIIVINNDDTRNIYINLPDAEKATINSKETNPIFIPENGNVSDIKGLIISKGNVIIFNSSSTNLNYNGTIVSDKNILLLGNGQKTFTYNYDWIAQTIASRSLLAEILHANTGKMLAIKERTVNGASTDPQSYTSSETADLSTIVVDNPLSTNININQNPVGGGLVKQKTEHSFVIKKWSIIK
jgi:hypothetical protein